ncbi:competence protein CoiA [Deinococcus sp. Leaf326]|uniref:competence protein CoiA n=1 Tax=Deinococcus sp. Leaf326 TaxID=1736338 RepID=UPI000700893A|nr:hypothetical protein [Deinococcus sp. Leaf326]KQR15448.1 hypothetical protein ASF71_20485 [Deinococcus sp. Leaf326]
MPLRAQLDDQTVQAWQYDPPTWAHLKQTYRQHTLRTSCCDQPAIPKTSTLGTPFFAHARRGPCTTAPETQEHLLLKAQVALAAHDAGWTVTTEYPGHTPTGEPWVADVYAERQTPTGTQRIAIEIQWSPQSLQETQHRQERYARSGIHALWLMRRLPTDTDDLPSDSQLPLFLLDGTGPDFLVQPMEAPLSTFIQGALGGQLLYWPRQPGPARLGLSTFTMPCWRCHRTISLIGQIHLQHPRYPHVTFWVPWATQSSVGDSDEGSAAFQALLVDRLDDQHRATLGLGTLKIRSSRTLQDAYLSQGCPHCDALQGDHFVNQHLLEALREDTLQAAPLWWPVSLTSDLMHSASAWFFLSRTSGP